MKSTDIVVRKEWAHGKSLAEDSIVHVSIVHKPTGLSSGVHQAKSEIRAQAAALEELTEIVARHTGNGLRPQIYEDITTERLRQIDKFGDQVHRSWTDLASILGEEYGEACKEANDIVLANADRLIELRKECIETAAVAVAIVEYIDRREND
jgi:hypothetical protein